MSTWALNDETFLFKAIEYSMVRVGLLLENDMSAVSQVQQSVIDPWVLMGESIQLVNGLGPRILLIEHYSTIPQRLQTRQRT